MLHSLGCALFSIGMFRSLHCNKCVVFGVGTVVVPCFRVDCLLTMNAVFSVVFIRE